jgi:hypothetical protein
MSVSQLFNGVTGVLIAPVDEGDGLRQKSWLAEISKYMQEGAESGLGRAVNFPAHFHGEQMGHQLIGDAAYQTPNYSGTDLYEAIAQRAVLGTGDGSETDFGNEALTDGDPTSANFFNTTTDPGDPVEPRGGKAAAFLQTLADGGGFNLSGTSGILTFRVNGMLFTVTGLTGGAVTAENLRDAILAIGAPVSLHIEGGDTLRIIAPGLGITSNVEAVMVTGDVAELLFTGASQSSQPNVMYKGTNGPLGQMDNSDVMSGLKPQRRILPGSISVTATIGAEAVVATDTHDGGDLATGTLSGQNAAGTKTITGTIDYATGVIDLDLSAAADNATDVLVTWKALVPLNLEEPVRISPNVGRNYALILK